MSRRGGAFEPVVLQLGYPLSYLFPKYLFLPRISVLRVCRSQKTGAVGACLSCLQPHLPIQVGRAQYLATVILPLWALGWSLLPVLAHQLSVLVRGYEQWKELSSVARTSAHIGICEWHQSHFTYAYQSSAVLVSPFSVRHCQNKLNPS